MLKEKVAKPVVNSDKTDSHHVVSNGKIPEPLLMEKESLMGSKGYLHAGLPKFDELFGRDSIVAAMQLLDHDPEIARRTLSELARLQGKRLDGTTGEEPGKILHELRELDDKGAVDEKQFEDIKSGVGWWKPNVPYYFSVDSTPLFLTLFAEYYNKTHDDKTLHELLPNLVAATKWILDYGIKDGLVRYDKPQHGSGLQSQSWKDGVGNLLDMIVEPVAVVEVQGYAYHALKSMEQILAGAGEGNLSGRMLAAAGTLKKRFNEEFWSPTDQFYYLAIGGDGTKIMRRTSNPGHLLFTGIIDKVSADAVVRELFSPGMITAYGIRTHASDATDFNQFAYQLGSVWPHDNWMIAKGLKAMGYKAEYNRLREATLDMYEDLKCCPEYVPVSKGGLLIDLNDARLVSPPCVPQAWTVGAVINFMLEGKMS